MVERVLAMECGRSRSPSLHLTWHASYRCFAFYEWFDYFTGSDDMSYFPLGFTGPLMKVSEAMEQVSMIKGNLEQVTAFLKTPELQRPADPVTLTDRHLNLVTFALVITKVKCCTISHLRRHRNQ